MPRLGPVLAVMLVAACGSGSTPTPAATAPADARPSDARPAPDASPPQESFELRQNGERTTADGVRVRYDGQEHKHGKHRTWGTDYFVVASGEATEKIQIESDDGVTERELFGHLVAIWIRHDGVAIVTVRQGPAPAPLGPLAAVRLLCDEAVKRGLPDCDKGTAGPPPAGEQQQGQYRMRNGPWSPALADYRTPEGAVSVQTWHDARAWRGRMGLHTRTIYEIVERSR